MLGLASYIASLVDQWQQDSSGTRSRTGQALDDGDAGGGWRGLAGISYSGHRAQDATALISSGNLPEAEPNCSLPLPHQPFPSHQIQEITELKASRSLSHSSGYAQGVQWWSTPTLIHSQPSTGPELGLQLQIFLPRVITRSMLRKLLPFAGCLHPESPQFTRAEPPQREPT